MNKKGLNLASPWAIFYHEIQALFEKDEDIKITFDEENYVIKLYVTGTDKAAALEELLPQEKDFGNITLKIEVIPANNENPTFKELYERAFAGNPIFSYASNGYNGITADNTYIVFRKEVVQYYNDSLKDINGLCSTLHQEVAKDVFDETPGVCYCTDTDKVHEFYF